MSDAQDASEHGRALARTKWQNTALTRAVATVIERRDRLDSSMREALQWAIAEPKGES